MQIFVYSNDGGKPFELFTSTDHPAKNLESGWWYQLQMPVFEPGDRAASSYVTDPDEDPVGPFKTITEAFNDAFNCWQGCSQRC